MTSRLVHRWASEHNLVPLGGMSIACIHHLCFKRPIHHQYCINLTSDFLDHVQIWKQSRHVRVLTAFPYGRNKFEEEKARIIEYIEPFDVQWFFEDSPSRMDFYNPYGTRPLIIASPGVDISEFLTYSKELADMRTEHIKKKLYCGGQEP